MKLRAIALASAASLIVAAELLGLGFGADWALTGLYDLPRAASYFVAAVVVAGTIAVSYLLFRSTYRYETGQEPN